MLREEDVEIQLGRCQSADGRFGSFLQVIHKPTGLKRIQTPLGTKKAWEVERRFLAEIEFELKEKGLIQYIVDLPPPSIPLNPES
jgi:hypothetical protein